jgi:NAD-dependent SIR2 family protein deacetylase
VFTSNVDHQFQRAGFHPHRIVECHGRIEVLQCAAGCGAPTFPAPPAPVIVDEVSFRAAPPLPSCPGCGRLARPNVLMFGDGGWDSTTSDEQALRLERWLAEVRARGARLVIVECGAGSAVPTVRLTGEHLARRQGALLIRVNVREAEAPPGAISVAAGALEALTRIDAHLD